MQVNQSSYVKILIFLLVGLIFAGTIVSYSKARSAREGRFVEDNGLKGFGEVEKKVERVFDVRPGGELSLETDAGSVFVEAWEKDQVAVTVGMSGDAEQLRRFKLDFQATDSTVSVLGKQRHRFFPWHWQSSDIEFRVKVPSAFRARVSTSGGEITAVGVRGNVKCETSGGDLTLSSIVGDVHGETSGGDVVIRNVLGDVQGHTSGGDIRVDSVAGAVRVSTSGGDIVLLRVDGKIHGETSGGSIEARLVGDNGGIHLETSGGNISVFVPKSITADVSASTSGGSVKCDLPLMVSGRISEDELHGKLNGGGNLIELSTSGGNIRIRSLD
jgi:DUF4097 and DUF4098 domain-containing protein YvlB